MRRSLVLLAVIAVMLDCGPRATPAAVPLDFIRPVIGPIVRRFEPPPTPFSAGHRGIDLAVPEGTVVRAVADGVVAFAGQVGGELFVSVDHDGGYRTTYSFLAAVTVRVGEAVEQGSPIAVSGLSHGEPALHFGLRAGSGYLDPEPWLLEGMRRNLWRVIRLVA